MPIFEYQCKSCDREFEALVRPSTTPACPHCGSTQLEKQLSVFATAGAGASNEPAMAAGPCGTCGNPAGPGACQFQ